MAATGHAALPEADVALQGRVTSQAEGAMEGVVVSAQKMGTTITLSILSNQAGDYQFPRAKLGAGVYALRIRAIGFDADNLAPVTIASGQPTLLNIPLKKTADLAAQLTNAEWIQSVPGTAQDKRGLLNCVACHTLERVVRSKSLRWASPNPTTPPACWR